MSNLNAKLVREATECGFAASLRDLQASNVESALRQRLASLVDTMQSPTRGAEHQHVTRDAQLEIASTEKRFRSDAQEEFDQLAAYLVQLGRVIDAATRSGLVVVRKETDGTLTVSTRQKLKGKAAAN